MFFSDEIARLYGSQQGLPSILTMHQALVCYLPSRDSRPFLPAMGSVANTAKCLPHDFENDLRHTRRFLCQNNIELWWEHEPVAFAGRRQSLFANLGEEKGPIAETFDSCGLRRLRGVW